MSVNSVVVSGNLTRDAELRQTQSGMAILACGIAVNDRVKSPSGEWTDYPNFLDFVVFGKRAESLSRILTKGMKVCVCGKLRYSSWEKDGQRRSKVEIIANDVDIMQRRDASQGQQGGAGGQYSNGGGNYTSMRQSAPQNGSQGAGDDFYDEDIPFDWTAPA
jgi:single-strand DNA-binding protein